jgi:hypothetical protein
VLGTDPYDLAITGQSPRLVVIQGIRFERAWNNLLCAELLELTEQGTGIRHWKLDLNFPVRFGLGHWLQVTDAA